jgi:hypothetical protein
VCFSLNPAGSARERERERESEEGEKSLPQVFLIHYDKRIQLWDLVVASSAIINLTTSTCTVYQEAKTWAVICHGEKLPLRIIGLPSASIVRLWGLHSESLPASLSYHVYVLAWCLSRSHSISLLTLSV